MSTPSFASDFAIWSWQTGERAGQNPIPDLVELIATAQRSISVIAFVLTHPALVDALIAAASRGVNVRLILDAGQANGATAKRQLARLQAAGVPVRLGQSERGGLIHLKKMVFDDTLLFTGSLNFSQAAILQENECYLFRWPAEAADRAANFEREWQRLNKPAQGGA